MSTERLQTLLEGAFPDASEVRVIDRGGGDHFEVRVTAPAFNGLTRIQQHKLVYEALDEPWQDGINSRAADQHERDSPVTEKTATYTEKIQDVIDGADVALFMKGTPEAIMCGNSERALGALRRAGAPITAVDVLLDMQIREDLASMSGWPTIPQVFVKGELVGGADIVEDMERSGELEQVLIEKLGDNYWDQRGESVVVLVER